MNRLFFLVKLLFEAYKEWVRNRAKVFGPSIAYYQLLSIAPFTGFVIFISHKVFGEEKVQQEVIPLLKNIVSPQLTNVIVYFLSTKKGMTTEELYALPILSGLLLLWSGKGYFSVIKQTIHIIWNKRQMKFGIKAKLHRDFESIKIALVSVSIILVFLFIRVLLPLPYIWNESVHSLYSVFAKLGEWIIGFIVVCTLRIFYFTYIPPVKIKWKNALPGAALGALLFLIGREMMETHFMARPQADAAESILMVMLWFYYSALVFIYSAEFSKLYTAKKQNIDLKSLHFEVDEL